MVSNCSAAGADSFVSGPAGIVQRKDSATGQTQPATVRPNGTPEAKPDTHLTAVTTTTSTLAALLSLQEV